MSFEPQSRTRYVCRDCAALVIMDHHARLPEIVATLQMHQLTDCIGPGEQRAWRGKICGVTGGQGLTIHLEGAPGSLNGWDWNGQLMREVTVRLE